MLSKTPCTPPYRVFDMTEIILKAVLSRTTKDEIKSKLMTPNLAQVSLDVYLDDPGQFTELVTMYEDELEVIIRRKDVKENEELSDT